MSERRRFKPATSALIGVALVAAACSGGGGDTIDVGLNVELTGDLPKVGEHSRVAAEMYVEMVNAAGGVEIGGETKELRLVVEDNGGTAEGAAAADFDDSAWRPVDVPHDWAIELPLDPSGSRDCVKHGYHALGPEHPEHSIGWYRRAFLIPAEDLGRRISVEFDGVFRDSITWLNGHYLGRHMSGYIGHAYDLSDCLNYGGNNVLVCRVDAIVSVRVPVP